MLVEGASSVSARLGIPAGIAGLTIVAIGTSLPELIINVFASLEGNTELAISNVLGSNIINILVIVGITAIISPIPVSRSTYFRDIPFSLFATALLFFLVQDVRIKGSDINVLNQTDGLIFIILLFIFLFVYYRFSKNAKADVVQLKVRPWLLSIFFLSAGITGLYFGGNLIVDGAVFVATDLGMDQASIGLTIVAMATSLPELVTSIIASIKGSPEMAIGNAVGSCIFNILLVLGLSSMINPQPFMAGSILDLIMVLVATVSLFVFVYTGRGRKISRFEGLIMIFMYVGYTWWVLRQLA